MFNRNIRNFKNNRKLGCIFVFIGGYTGLLTCLLLGNYANCMTGNITETGINLSSLNFQKAFLFFMIVLFFIFGAFLSAKIIDNSKNGHLPILILESFILISLKNFFTIPALILSSMAMGLQNGLSTYITWGKGNIRTTHITGTTTDIGISLANKNLHETGFNVLQVSMFFIGAVFAFFIAEKIGSYAFSLAGIAILSIALLDLYLKFINNKHFHVNGFRLNRGKQ